MRHDDSTARLNNKRHDMIKQWLAWAGRAANMPAIMPAGGGDAAAVAQGADGGCLAFDNVSNARDLGGLVGAGGRRVRAGKLFRSGNPGLASAADIERLVALGPDMVIDFRSPGEKSVEERGFGERFRWVAVPVLEGSMAMDVLMPRLRDGSPAQMSAFMLEVYRDFPQRYREAFGGFLKTAESGKTLFYHCTAGKDRTGFASLLLLSALGVGQDDILANYLASNHWNARFNEGALSKLSAFGVRPEVVMPLLEVTPAYLEASVRAIEEVSGGIERYLRESLCVDVDRLRDHYLEA